MLQIALPEYNLMMRRIIKGSARDMLEHPSRSLRSPIQVQGMTHVAGCATTADKGREHGLDDAIRDLRVVHLAKEAAKSITEHCTDIADFERAVQTALEG